jgi:CDP-glycerol glycerophosphotransferase
MASRSFIHRARQAVRTVVLDAGKRAPWFLTAVRTGIDVVRGADYRLLRLAHPVQRSVAVFESYMGRAYACSPRALYQQMRRDPAYADVEKVWVLSAGIVRALRARGGYRIVGDPDSAPGPALDGDIEKLFGTAALDELRDATIIVWGSRECMRQYARAAMWVTNSVIPTFLTPRRGQTYVQTWHGTPLKRLGCDIKADISMNAVYSARDMHRRYAREGARLTWLLSPSRYASERFVSAFDLVASGRTSAIVEEGYPRNDYLHTFTPEDVTAIRARLGIPEGKKVVLYAPTWRDNMHVSGVGYTYEAQADFELLREALGGEYVVLFRAHYFVASAFDFAAYGGFVIDVSKTDDINDLYVISDLLVTDYSSVFFDYANLHRPVVFFMYDLDDYAGEVRGFYLSLDELPGPIVRTTPELVDAVRAAAHRTPADEERDEAFRRRFTYLDDGRASARVLARVAGARMGAATGADAGGSA